MGGSVRERKKKREKERPRPAHAAERFFFSLRKWCHYRFKEQTRSKVAFWGINCFYFFFFLFFFFFPFEVELGAWV